MKYTTIGYHNYLSYMTGKNNPDNIKKFKEKTAKTDLKALEKIFYESEYKNNITGLKFNYNSITHELELNLSYEMEFPAEFKNWSRDTIDQYLENKFKYDRENIRNVVVIKHDDYSCML